jgi:hypothetical protein
MLALRLRRDGFVFVYRHGVPIGAILVGQASPNRSSLLLLFSGDSQEFQILRPEVVAQLFGEQELQRLIERFAL